MIERGPLITISEMREILEKEGVLITRSTIFWRIRQAIESGIITKVAKDTRGKTQQVLKKPAYYLESEIRAACHDLIIQGGSLPRRAPFNPPPEYFLDPVKVLADLNFFASQLPQIPEHTNVPADLNVSHFSLSITCCNGDAVNWRAYLCRAALDLGIAENSGEAISKLAETVKILLKIAGVEVRNSSYFKDRDIVLYDMEAFAAQLARYSKQPRVPADLSTQNIRPLQITCHNGERFRGAAYLHAASIAVGLADKAAEAASIRSETLRLLLKTAGIEIQDQSYFTNREFVRYDLSAYAAELSHVRGSPKDITDLSMGNIRPLVITCHNDERVRGGTYVIRAGNALKLSGRGQSRTLWELKEIAGFKS